MKRVYGTLFASVVGILLATLPGSIERSAAGFGDRDAWCWMIGTLAVTSYLWKEQMEPGWHRYLATTLAGFIVFLGGMSWEGFGFFPLIILTAELWRFCTTDKEQHLKEYLLWILMFAPWLYLISPAYRSGYGFSTHITALMLLPPLVIFAIRGLRYLLFRFSRHLRPHARKLAWGLTLLAIASGLCYIFLQADTFQTTAFTFHESALMQSIGELADPDFGYWKDQYGSVFVFGSIGLITISIRLWKWKGLPLALSLFFFTLTTFFRTQINGWIGEDRCNMLFFILLGLTVLSLGIGCLRKEAVRNEFVTLVLLAWFLLWVGLSRGGKRHDFFIGVPLVFFTASFLHFLSNILSHKLRNSGYTTDKFRKVFQHAHLKTGFASVMLVLLLFWSPIGGHAHRSLHAATKMRNAIPGYSQVNAAFLWMKIFLLKQVEDPYNVVVASHWDYGSQLNVIAGVKTITDQDHYLPHWIHLYNQHVHFAKSEREVLTFLRTHNVTHLLLSRKDPKKTFLNGDLSSAFVPLFPEKNFAAANVKVWAIHYPPDIKTDDKYLATEPEASDEK
ncbi:MAG: hypothetical protein OXH00_14925 [Candidatus Poribacteria bacterium]|nr:hypothetical protein [Candidatus Poribacteria bacterium]